MKKNPVTIGEFCGKPPPDCIKAFLEPVLNKVYERFESHVDTDAIVLTEVARAHILCLAMAATALTAFCVLNHHDELIKSQEVQEWLKSQKS